MSRELMEPAQQEAQIVRWNCPCGNKYTFHGFTKAPPQRTWVGLTEKDKEHLSDLSADPRWNAWIGMEQTEAKLKEKNT